MSSEYSVQEAQVTHFTTVTSINTTDRYESTESGVKHQNHNPTHLVYILLVRGKHLHACIIIPLRGEVWAHRISLTPPAKIYVLLTLQEGQCYDAMYKHNKVYFSFINPILLKLTLNTNQSINQSIIIPYLHLPPDISKKLTIDKKTTRNLIIVDS